MTQATKTAPRKAAPAKAAKASAPASPAPAGPALAPGTILADLEYTLDGTTKTTSVFVGGDNVFRTSKQYLDAAAGTCSKIRVYVEVVA